MAIHTDRLDDCVLAMLCKGGMAANAFGSRSTGIRWIDFIQKGLISDPVGRAKSVVLTDEGLEKAERLSRDLFGTNP